MFLQMWSVITRTTTHLPAYGPYIYHPEEFDTDGYVQPYGDSPLDSETVGENVYLNMINQAKKYVYISTPYLIIDNEMMTALCLASKKGVDVRIITPAIPDKKVVFLLTQSYYSQLVEAGLRSMNIHRDLSTRKTLSVMMNLQWWGPLTWITAVCTCILSAQPGCTGAEP